MSVQLTSKTAAAYKAQQIVQQNNCCKLCGQPLDLADPLSVHLDHDHITGHCRGVLHRACNTFEGMVLHKFSRSGLKSEHEYIQWLKMLIEYLETDASMNPLHPNHVGDSVKRFKSKSKSEQEDVLNSLGVAVPEKSTKSDLTKLYRKHLVKPSK